MADPDSRRAPPFRNLESQSGGRIIGGAAGGWFAVPFAIRLWIALAFVITASIFAFLQSPRPDAFRRPPALLSGSWWRYPLEWNAPSRLPKIGVSLNAIQVAPNTSHVWAAGRQGMVVRSTDGGATWERRGITEDQLVSPSPSPTPTPTPTRPPPAASSFLSLPDLVPTANAAEIERTESPQNPRQQVTPVSRPTPTPNRASRPPGPQSTPRQATPGFSSQPTPTPTAVASPMPQFETQSLIAVVFHDTALGEVRGERQERFFTTDGGVTWIRDIFFDEMPQRRPDGLRYQRAFQWWPGFGDSRRDPARDVYQIRYFAVNTQGVPYVFGGLNTPDEYQRWSQALARSAFYDAGLPAYNLHFLDDRANGWVVGAKGRIWHTSDYGLELQALPAPDYGTTERVLPAPSSNDLYSVYFLDSNRGWVAGSNGVIFTTSDGGNNWQRQDSGTRSQLNSIYFLPDGSNGWIAGEHGLILSTNDGGATWVHRTQGNDAGGNYLRFPAPWFFLVLLIVPLLLLRRANVQASEPEESVADLLVSDRPLDTSAGDVLAFNSIALGLSRFLRNENTMPPLTIAIIGEWGTGKSSLMNLLRADLRSYKFRPVWFNAWHHQKEEHMLASLLENIKLQAVPRWWSNRGLMFRAKLLGIRGWRHWLPLVLLLFFIYVLLIYHFGRGGTDASYAGLMSWLAAAVSHPLETSSNLVPFVPLLAGIFAFLGAVWRGITAFGVKPASLLAGVSSGASIRGLEAQTSFRQKFAVEFNDVTRALGKRSLLIFIDDLDRCRPENVLETLEAVNFLTTSGECFVVIGMAREYVERCVGRAFKDIAEEMIDDVDKRQSTNGDDQTPEELAKEKRIEFARQYLDKLINIEVPIPAAKQGQSLKLLLAGAYQPSVPEPKSRWQELKSSFARVLARHWRVLPALTALAVLLTLGYFLAMSLVGQAPASSATVSVMAATTARATIIAAVEINLVATASPPQTSTPPRSAAPSSPTPSPTALPSPSPTAEILNERAEIIAGGRGLFSRTLLPAIALLAMMWVGVTVLTRRPDLVVKDSPNFVDALKIWHPLIFSRQSTPRSIKRFMNRIRYLAMRQRSVTESESSWWRRLVRSSELPRELPPDAAASAVGIPVDPIPDEALVALAAIEHFSKSVFADSAPSADWPPKKIRSTDSVVTFTYHADLQNLLTTARAEHEKRFGNFDVMKYRDRFVDIAASVEVR